MSRLTYLSLGAGRQSTALLVMSALGLRGCPKADVAIFADTGDEPPWVYEHLAWLEAWSPIPIERVQKGHLGGDMLRRAKQESTRTATIPAWTCGADGREAPLRRQCTREYKIDPIEKRVRELLGYQPRRRIPVDSAVALLGISLDEAQRARPSRSPWIRSDFPLIRARMRVSDCVSLIAEHGVPVPRKSSCIFCPYHSDDYWRSLKSDHPAEFAKAVEFDSAIRDMSMSGINEPIFLHRSLRPLGTVDFDEKNLSFPWAVCDSGYCGV